MQIRLTASPLNRAQSVGFLGKVEQPFPGHKLEPHPSLRVALWLLSSKSCVRGELREE
jgi:hypothetical protein